MDCKELRIGNWIMRESQKDGFQIDENSFSICKLYPNWYNPIPITEEWLLKLGFVINRITKEENNIWRKNFEDGFFELEQIISFYFGSPLYAVDIKYVHQLQNLYIAITGEELEIKE
jgi:hypothetical protein